MTPNPSSAASPSQSAFPLLSLLTDTVSLPLLPPSPLPHFHYIPQDDDNAPPPVHTFRANPVIFLKSLLHRLFLKLLRNLLLLRRDRPRDYYPYPEPPFQCPSHRLRIFRNLTRLHFHLLIKSNASDDAAFLKWKSSYDTKLKSIVILGATELHPHSAAVSSAVVLPNEVLTSRMKWTIACLIGAQVRHFVLKKMLLNFPTTLKSILITDQKRLGRFAMEDGEIGELRESLKREGVPVLTVMQMVPEMRMKMWYVPELVLPASGYVMKGATLIVIGQPDGGPLSAPEEDGSDGGYDSTEAENAVYREAEREIGKKEGSGSYVVEVTAF